MSLPELVGQAARSEGVARLGRPQLNVLLPGLYAWAATLAFPALGSHAPGSARALAALALVMLLAGLFCVPTRPLLGRALGIQGFVLSSALGWILLERAGISLFGHTVEAAVGALGWMLFAFGWGDLRERQEVPERDPRVLPGPALFPRAVLSRSVEAVLGIAVLGALLLGVLAWGVARPTHALWAHAAALLLGLLLVGAGARVALERTARRFPASSERLNTASSSLAVLLITLGLGALYWMLER